MFPTKTYVKRREQLQKKVKSGLILLLGNEESSMNYTDNHYHFRQDSNFLYFLGLDMAGLNGVIDIDNNQITSGQNLLSIKFTADYALSKNLNALFFYDHSFSQFAVSTAFPQTTINTGFTLRYNFGN